MVRYALFVAFAVGCAGLPPVPPSVPPTPSEASCEAFKAEEVKYLHCLVSAQKVELERVKRAPPPVAHPAPAGIAVGEFVPRGFVRPPTLTPFVTADTTARSEGGVTVYSPEKFQGSTARSEPLAIECGFTEGSGHLPALGGNIAPRYVDMNGDGTVYGMPYVCAPAGGALTFHNVPRRTFVTVVFALPTDQVLNGTYVYKAMEIKKYSRGDRPGYAVYSAAAGITVRKN